MNLTNLAVRVMPISVCLGPRHSYRKNMTAISAYLWVIMISMESTFHISPQIFSMFRGIFSYLYLLVLLVFFKRTLPKKGSLCISTWLFAALPASLNEFAAWILKGYVSLIYGQICVAISLLWAYGFHGFVRLRLRDRVNRFFNQLSRRFCFLLLTYLLVSLFVFFTRNNTTFPPHSLAERGLEDVLSYLVLCIMILVLYVFILSSILEIMCRRRTEGELQFARQLISQQGKYYNQTLDYIEQVRIIKHDFRHHIHALLNMNRGEQTDCLINLKRELNMTVKIAFCRNQVISELLQEYAARVRQNGVEFTARVDLPAHVSADDLILCAVTGNPLGNVLGTCRRLTGPRFILVQTGWLDDHLMMLVENSYNGQIKKNGGRILSSKWDGSLGVLSTKRILSQPGDEFGVDYNDTTSTTMVKVVDRVLGQDILPDSLPAQDKIKVSQSS